MTDIKLSAGLAGRYQIRVIRPDGTVRLETPWFDNLILNSGLNRIGTGGIGNYCHVGTGSAAAVVTDTALQSFLASTSSTLNLVSDVVTTPTRYGFHRCTYRFNAGVATGNISEVGISWSSTTGSLFSRALILDGDGDPTTITLLSDEVLDVTYELRIYPPADDVAFTMTVSGVTYNCVARAATFNASYWTPAQLFLFGTTFSSPNVSAHAGSLGTVDSYPSGTQHSGSCGWESYANNSYQRTGIMSFPLALANYPGGIGAFYIFVYGSWAFQFSVDPKIPKNNTQELTIRATTSWARRTL